MKTKIGYCVRSLLTAAIITGAMSASVIAQTRDDVLRRSPASDIPVAGIERVPVSTTLSNGLTISMVFFDLRGTTGTETGDSAARRGMEKALGIQGGDSFDETIAEAGVSRVRKVAGVRSADITLYPAANDRQVVLVVSATLGEKPEPSRKGLFVGNKSDFPLLWKSDQGYLKLQLNGALGLYSDTNPWFGNSAAFTAASPIALDPPGKGTTFWGEAAMEYGFNGYVRLGQKPIYAYGAFTAYTTMSAGNDLFRKDARIATRVEKAFVGLLFKPEKKQLAAQVSVGRQNWQLNDGFLFSQFSGAANAGPLPGLYQNPRTAFEETYIAKGRVGNLSGEWFYVDPEELDFAESRTVFRGLNVNYSTRSKYFASFAYVDVPRSNTTFANPTGGRVPRKGQRIANARLGTRQLLNVPGLEVLGEYAHQWNPGNNVGADAGYISAGYTFLKEAWRPSLTYRFAHFSGDDPSTTKYERFDAPLSSGLDNWVQGINFKKVVTNSNLDSHRVRLNVTPTQNISLTFDYFYLYAPIRSAGGNTVYGQEVNGAIRWLINRRLFFLGVTGIGVPGSIIKERGQNNTNNWFTLQGSLFWNL